MFCTSFYLSVTLSHASPYLLSPAPSSNNDAATPIHTYLRRYTASHPGRSFCSQQRARPSQRRLDWQRRGVFERAKDHCDRPFGFGSANSVVIHMHSTWRKEGRRCANFRNGIDLRSRFHLLRQGRSAGPLPIDRNGPLFRMRNRGFLA